MPAVLTEIRKELYSERPFCTYCKKRVYVYVEQYASNRATLDHVIPKSRGGKTIRENLVLCCKNCNEIKRDLPLQKAFKNVELETERTMKLQTGPARQNKWLRKQAEFWNGQSTYQENAKGNIHYNVMLNASGAAQDIVREISVSTGGFEV